MKRFEAQYRGAAALIVLASTSGASAAGAGQGGASEVFEVPYGTRAGCVGVAPPDRDTFVPGGPGDIKLARNGDILIGDQLNRRVERFNQSGRLISVTKPILENVSMIAANDSGGFWVLHGWMGDVLSRFNPDGSLACQVDLQEGEPRQQRVRPIGPFYGASDDGVWVQCMGLDQGCALVDKNGGVVRFRPVSAVLADGTGVLVRLRAKERGDRRAIDYRLAGPAEEPLRSTALRLPPPSATSENVTDDGGGPNPELKFDASGCCYRLWAQAARYPVTLGQGLEIRSEVVITKHGPGGEPVAQVALPGTPFLTTFRYDVAPDGSLYYLSFGPEAMYVMRYRFPTGQGFTVTRALPALKLAGRPCVPLDSVAANEGWAVRWKAASKVAEVRTRAGAAKAVVLHAAGGDVVMHFGRLWISERSARTLGAALRSGDKGRVALLTKSVRLQ